LPLDSSLQLGSRWWVPSLSTRANAGGDGFTVTLAHYLRRGPYATRDAANVSCNLRFAATRTAADGIGAHLDWSVAIRTLPPVYNRRLPE
jgi:hypothetical protein